MPYHGEIYGSPLYYLYPITEEVSFREIAKQHIKYLDKIKKTRELDVNTVSDPRMFEGKNVIIHPYLYPFIGTENIKVLDGEKNLSIIAESANTLIGIDTADSDRISDVAAKLCNFANLLILPSNWAKEAYTRSGVKTKIEVIPHGIPDQFLTQEKSITSFKLTPLLIKKRTHGLIFILFDIRHSGYRKGADLVAKAISDIQKTTNNVILLIKRFQGIDPYLGQLKQTKHVEISSFLSLNEYRQLFDLADIALFPSRGGGFEVQALEAISRGVPTIVPNAGCFKDYIQYTIKVKVNSHPTVLPRNPIHIGRGHEISVKDLKETLINVIDRLNHYKEIFQAHALEVRKKYNWKTITNYLIEVLRKHGAIQDMSKPRVRRRLQAIIR